MENQIFKNLIILSFLTLLHCPTIQAQEKLWDRFKPKEFSEPIFLLQQMHATSFELLTDASSQKYSLHFVNDSVIALSKNSDKYILRDNLVLPILNKQDSAEFHNFYKDRKIEHRDSSNMHITTYFEKSNTGKMELTMIIYQYPDSTVTHSYGDFQYKHTSISNQYEDSTITINHWFDSRGESIETEKYTRQILSIGADSLTQTTYFRRKEGSEELPETEVYILTIKKSKDEIDQILFESNVNGLTNYLINEIKYRR